MIYKWRCSCGDYGTGPKALADETVVDHVELAHVIKVWPEGQIDQTRTIGKFRKLSESITRSEEDFTGDAL